MKTLLYPLLLLLMILTACSSQVSSVSSAIEKLNREASKVVVEASNRQVTDLFNKTLERDFYNRVCGEADALRNEAFDTDDFKKVDRFSEKAFPVYRVVFGGDANFISPNVIFFLEKCASGTSEYRFFELALTGWVDIGGEPHGGKENFPAWVDQTDGISGNFIQGAGAKALEKWRGLLPELSGNYRQIASNTIAYIEKMTKE